MEVDECKLHSPKYHRGHPPATDDIWVVRVVERDRDGNVSRRSALVLTNERPSAVLVPFIKKLVAKESILISDGWRGYSAELKDYVLHKRVIHEHEIAHTEIVDGVEVNVNTNHIEREWVEVRKVVAHFSPDCYQAQLNKEIFRLLYLAGKKETEKPYIFMEKMAESFN